jgi:hypothetical protein
VAYAEQFVDPDSNKLQLPEELLAGARMILSTELGKDPFPSSGNERYVQGVCSDICNPDRERYDPKLMNIILIL